MKVMAIAPYDGLKELIIKLGQNEDFDLQVEVGDLQKGVTLAKEAVNDGTDIIISRGGTAELIQKEVPVPVIEIEVSGYDMLRILTLVKDYPGKTAIVGFSPILEGADAICEILDMDISTYRISNEEEVEPNLVKLQQKGYQMIIGDVITVKKAENLGLNGIFLTSGKESVLKAFQNAKKVHDFFSALKNKYLISHNIVQEEKDGVIVYNQNFQSVFSNPYFKEEVNKVFEDKINIKDAVKEVLNRGIFQTIFNEENVFWKVTGSLIPSFNLPLAVFRIQRYQSNEKQNTQGISIVSSLTENSSANIITGMVTNNEEMNHTLKMAEVYCDKEEPIWISGEAGTGKEGLAYYIHFNSIRRSYPLLVIDCGLIEGVQWDTVLDTELENNLISHNENGTVFLKNINYLKLSIQKKLMDYLCKRPLRCRLLVSSCENMQTLIKKGDFYQDLYYLLARLSLHLPSLRNRKEDIESFSRLFISEFNTKFGKQIVGVRVGAREELEKFEFPGNIEQLKQVIEESVLLANGPYIEKHDVKEVLKLKQPLIEYEKAEIDLSGTLEEIEKRIIKKVWLEEEMNHTKTADRLGINRTTLWRKLK
ncbi:sigma-54-dependent Fis family transcriptional regulator [Bacillus sp. OTU530]|uniref:sigma-54-dependent Fis family transcriptional regulator n=1 Tax=Bacillus sp. OTU530 TaxID=3043862 RepID=UPI00313D350B